jgi:hypothetical protein
LEDAFDNCIGIFNDLTVPEAKHVITSPLEMRGSLGICFSIGNVLTAVDFDNKLPFDTDKINKVRCETMLPAKLATRELAVPDALPQ